MLRAPEDILIHVVTPRSRLPSAHYPAAYMTRTHVRARSYDGQQLSEGDGSMCQAKSPDGPRTLGPGGTHAAQL